MKKSITDYFPKYHQLDLFEKIILRTCCYFPPKTRRERQAILEYDLNKYADIFKKAYGTNVFEIFKGKKILDFGCGEGSFSLAIGKSVPCSRVIGIDIQNYFEAALNQMNKEKIINVNFILGSSNTLDSNSFDFVFSHDSFEHFENPKYILSEMLRITKPGGVLLIKFGPTWKNPYGRHMGGTYRKDRPWIHLLIPEKKMMRVHSVYHNKPILHEKYSELEGGLNKMTVKKAIDIFSSFEQAKIIEKKRTFIWKGAIFKNIPFLNEFFSSSLCVKLEKLF